MSKRYRIVEVSTPSGVFRKRTTQVVAVVSIYRALRELRRSDRRAKPGDLFAVWHRTHKAAADAPRLLFSSRMVGQYFIEERQWEAME